MNTVRLVFGWLFLVGFTAAGTYYAMDEADQRVGLGRFQLHEKFGLVKMAATQVTPPINNQVPPIVQPPINNQNPPNTSPPPVYVPPNNNQIPPNTNPPPVYTPPNNNQNPPNTVTPPVYVPPNNNQNPLNNNQRPVYVPPNNNQVPPNNSVAPPPNNNPPVITQRQRPADFTETNIRLVQIQGQASRLRSTIGRMRGPYGTARLDEPMSNLTNFLRQAEGALNSGDTGSARRYMDQADIQVGKLKELLDQ